MMRSSRILLPFLLLACALASRSAAAQIGSVLHEEKITGTPDSLGTLGFGSFLGCAVARVGDLDRDGITDLAVGAKGWGIRGAVFVLFLRADGTVRAQQRIAQSDGGFGGILDPSGEFGNAVCPLGDLDGDGNPDLAVGAWRDGEGSDLLGSIWILFLDADGTVKSEQHIGPGLGGFGGVLHLRDMFG